MLYMILFVVISILLSAPVCFIGIMAYEINHILPVVVYFTVGFMILVNVHLGKKQRIKSIVFLIIAASILLVPFSDLKNVIIYAVGLLLCIPEIKFWSWCYNACLGKDLSDKEIKEFLHSVYDYHKETIVQQKNDIQQFYQTEKRFISLCRLMDTISGSKMEEKYSGKRQSDYEKFASGIGNFLPKKLTELNDYYLSLDTKLNRIDEDASAVSSIDTNTVAFNMLYMYCSENPKISKQFSKHKQMKKFNRAKCFNMVVCFLYLAVLFIIAYLNISDVLQITVLDNNDIIGVFKSTFEFYFNME